MDYFTVVSHRVGKIDPLREVIPGDSRWNKLHRWFRKRCLISARNKRSQKYLRSQAAISYERHRHIRNFKWMIHPFSEFRVIYEIIIIIVYGYSLFYQPLETVYMFTKNHNFTAGVTALFVCDFISMIGIVINFRTGYLSYKTNEVFLSPNLAARHYLRSYFVIDLFSCMPFQLALPLLLEANETTGLSAAMDLLSMFKIVRVFPMLRFFLHTKEVFDMNFFVYHTTKMIFLSVLFLHFAGAIHVLVPKLVSKDCNKIAEESWFSNICETIRTHPFYTYLRGLFRAVSNAFHVGYGQVIPNTMEDMAVTMSVMVVSHVLVYCAIARMFCIASTLVSSKATYYKKMQQLEGYIEYKKLPPPIRSRIIATYDYTFHKTHFREDKILDTVSPGMREEVMMSKCQRMVENVNFFSNLPRSLIARIVMSLHGDVFLQNDIIIKAGELGHSMYFIKKGTVAIYKKSGRELCHLEDGSHFGEIALIMKDELRVATVVAVEHCSLYRLDRADFVKAIRPFPDILARIEHVAKERLEQVNRIQEIFERSRRNSLFSTLADEGSRTSLLYNTSSIHD